jgi:hypothetical protein
VWLTDRCRYGASFESIAVNFKEDSEKNELLDDIPPESKFRVLDWGAIVELKMRESILQARTGVAMSRMILDQLVSQLFATGTTIDASGLDEFGTPSSLACPACLF